jgi:hypothetical protein
MLGFSSLASSLSLAQSNLLGQPSTETTEAGLLDPPSSTDDDDEEASYSESIYHDVCTESTADIMEQDDAVSCSGTILASLSSKEVSQNLAAGLRPAGAPLAVADLPSIPGMHPLSRRRNLLSEVATISSDVLSFTPTMAEMVLSRRETKPPDENSNRVPSEHYHQDTCTGDDRTTVSAFGIQTVQPERVACPFCYREKDLQWQLTREREQSIELKVAEHQSRIILVATVLSFLVAIGAFFLGKMISDREGEKAMAQYKAQCSDMIAQKEGDELYWKLVNAAFSAMVNAVAGPLANFVLGTGKN